MRNGLNRSIRRQIKIGKIVLGQGNFNQTELMILEAKHKLMQCQEEYLNAIASEDYEKASDCLTEMKGWTDDIIEFNYDLDNCKEEINKDRKYLGLAEML